MSLPDTIFIFALALVIFGPKKLPEIGRQIGKLIFEFRRASNEFKLQIEEELRAAEEADRQKKLAAAAAPPTSPKEEAISIRPPSTGEIVSAGDSSGGISTAAETPSGEAPGVEPLSNPAAEVSQDNLPQVSEPVSEDSFSALHVNGEELELPAPGPEPAALPAPPSASEDTAAVAAEGSIFTGDGGEDAARRAEAHIQEQIAVHHG